MIILSSWEKQRQQASSRRIEGQKREEEFKKKGKEKGKRNHRLRHI